MLINLSARQSRPGISVYANGLSDVKTSSSPAEGHFSFCRLPQFLKMLGHKERKGKASLDLNNLGGSPNEIRFMHSSVIWAIK